MKKYLLCYTIIENHGFFLFQYEINTGKTIRLIGHGESQPHKGHLTSKLKYRRFSFYLLCTLLLFAFHLLPSPVHPTGFSFYFFPGFLAIFTLLSLNSNNLIESTDKKLITAKLVLLFNGTCKVYTYMHIYLYICI